MAEKDVEEVAAVLIPVRSFIRRKVQEGEKDSRCVLWTDDERFDNIHSSLVHTQENRGVPGDRKVCCQYSELVSE